MQPWEAMKKIVRAQQDATGQKQKFIAGICGYSEQTFSQLLNGHKLITADDIRKFCNGMNVSPNELFADDNEPRAG